MKNFLATIFLGLLFSSPIFAQILHPVKWTSDKKEIATGEYELVWSAKIDHGWAIYSQYLESDDGPIRTSFNFDEGDHYELVGKNVESGGKKEMYDKLFEMNLIKFYKNATFTQKIKVLDPSKPITGYFEYMTCDDTKCLPPDQVDFEFKFDTPASKVPKTGEAKTTPQNDKESQKTIEKAAGSMGAVKSESSNKGMGHAEENSNSGSLGKKGTEKENKNGKSAEAKIDTRNPSKSVDGQGNIFDPTDWAGEIFKNSEGNYTIQFDVQIDEGWHVYSRYLEDGDAIPTEIFFNEGDNFTVDGKGSEDSPKIIKEYDKGFGMNLIKLKKSASFLQPIKVTDPSKDITGFLTFAVCDQIGCLPPEDIPFKANPAAGSFILGDEAEDNPVATTGEDSGIGIVAAAGAIGSAKMVGNEVDHTVAAIKSTYKNPLGNCGEEQVARDQSLLVTFILGFLGGLVALLTPCVFPMIPLTVSYFTKGSKDRASGIKNGLIYGLCIIGIYVGIGLAITAAFGPDALNALSTNWIANTLFFIIFIAFALSFFGYYEITLPSSWANKTDSMADQGGFVGTFFMAFTLALVSFSCTGPIIGSALVTAATNPIGPSMVMFGFSLALALPFGLFAAFPAWLNSLPRSGSWMTSVKVVLGFLELALALKFLSIADMTMHWGFLRYEVFMGLWVIIFAAMTAYLLGYIRFPHDSPLKKIKPTRGIFAVLAIGFTIYLATGFMKNSKTGDYNSLAVMSGLAPPAYYNFFNERAVNTGDIKDKYPTYTKCANNINCFKDYYEGIAFAKERNLPVFLDFTGYGCVNCRKTEEHIWIDDNIMSKLNDEFVLVSLYVDDRKSLEQILISLNTHKKLRNVGNIWSDFQIVNFEQNSQPLYVMMTPDEEVLAAPRGYQEGISSYTEFLNCGLATFNKKFKKKMGALH